MIAWHDATGAQAYQEMIHRHNAVVLRVQEAVLPPTAKSSAAILLQGLLSVSAHWLEWTRNPDDTDMQTCGCCLACGCCRPVEVSPLEAVTWHTALSKRRQKYATFCNLGALERWQTGPLLPQPTDCQNGPSYSVICLDQQYVRPIQLQLHNGTPSLLCWRSGGCMIANQRISS